MLRRVLDRFLRQFAVGLIAGVRISAREQTAAQRIGVVNLGVLDRECS